MSTRLFRTTLLLAALALGVAGAHAQEVTTTRYLDATAGNDADDGATPATAWKSLVRANVTTFGPGGSLLLKNGETWSGTLSPKGSGAEGNAFRIGRYGAGAARPRIDGPGTDRSSAMTLFNQEYIEVTGLEFTNFQTGVLPRTDPAFVEPLNKRAIYVVGRDMGAVNHLVFRDIVVHDVNSGLTDTGTNPSRFYGGFFAEITGSAVQTYFDRLVVEDSHFYDVDRTALSNSSSWATRSSTSSFGDITVGTTRDNWIPSVGVAYRNNLIERSGGNGIIVRAARNAVVERNRLFHNGNVISGNAMFCFSTDSTLFQYNEAAFQEYSAGDTDAAGIDSDYQTKYTIIQYNYLHNNGQGGIVATGGPGDDRSPRFNVGTVVRYNVMVDNQRYGIHTSGVLTNMLVHNNVFYTSSAISNVDVVDNGRWGGVASDGDRYHNNIFANYGSSPDYILPPSTNYTFSHNLYAGTFSVTLPPDANRVAGAPMFVGPVLVTADNFKLQDGSPAIGSGLRLAGMPAVDYFGNPLGTTGPIDLGVQQRSLVTAGEETAAAGSDALSAAPNPSRGAVSLSFEMAQAGTASITVFDVLGRKVLEATETLSVGRATVRLDAQGLPAGAYVARVDRGDDRPISRRITIVGANR